MGDNSTTESFPVRPSRLREIVRKVVPSLGGREGGSPSSVLPTYEDPADLATSPAYLSARERVRESFRHLQNVRGTVEDFCGSGDRNAHRGMIDGAADAVDMLARDGDIGQSDHLNLLENSIVGPIVGRRENSGHLVAERNPFVREDKVRLLDRLLERRVKSDPLRWHSGGFHRLQQLEEDLTLDILRTGSSQHTQKVIESIAQNGSEQATKVLVLKVLQLGPKRNLPTADATFSSLVDVVFPGQPIATHLHEYVQTGSPQAWNRAIATFVDQEVDTFDTTRAGENTYRHSMLYASEVLRLLDTFSSEGSKQAFPYLHDLSQSEKAPVAITRQAAKVYNDNALVFRKQPVTPRGVPNPLGGFYG